MWMLLYFLILSLLTFGSVELFLHWLQTWLHTENFWQLCLILTKTGDRWEWLLQHLCRCCKQSVRVSARPCVFWFSLCFSIAERAETLFELLWDQLRNGTRRGGYGKHPTRRIKCQPVFLCSPWLIAKVNVLRTLKTWPNPDWNQGGFLAVFGLDTVS